MCLYAPLPDGNLGGDAMDKVEDRQVPARAAASALSLDLRLLSGRIFSAGGLTRGGEAPGPVSRSAGQPVSRSAGQPVSRSAGQPVSRSAGQPVSRSAGQPVSRSAGQPVSRSAGQPVSRSAGQPVSRSAGQPVSPTWVCAPAMTAAAWPRCRKGPSSRPDASSSAGTGTARRPPYFPRTSFPGAARAAAALLLALPSAPALAADGPEAAREIIYPEGSAARVLSLPVDTPSDGWHLSGPDAARFRIEAGALRCKRCVGGTRLSA